MVRRLCWKLVMYSTSIKIRTHPSEKLEEFRVEFYHYLLLLTDSRNPSIIPNIAPIAPVIQPTHSNVMYDTVKASETS